MRQASYDPLGKYILRIKIANSCTNDAVISCNPTGTSLVRVMSVLVRSTYILSQGYNPLT